MTDTSVALDQEAKRYPLSFTQEWFITMDQGDDGGPFGGRFLIVSALRVTGAVDPAVLQGALDDVVARHELLRTLVVRDADPPYQMVRPPCPVPLEVRDPPPATRQVPGHDHPGTAPRDPGRHDQRTPGAAAARAAVPVRWPEQRLAPDRAPLGL